MKRIVLLAAFAAMSACSQSEDTPAAPEAAPAEEAAPAVTAADGGAPHGTFKITMEDGSVTTEEVREDGTYTSTSADGEVETGKWVQKSSNTYCTTKDEEGAAEVCHNETVDDKGVWTSVDPEGNKVTVERVTT